MPKFTTIQQRFTQGELDPSMLGREDIDQYFGALSTAKNILTLPQGGFKRRPGLEHIDRVLGNITKISGGSITETAPRGGTASNASDQDSGTSLTTTTNIGTINPYVVAHYDLGSLQDIGVVYIQGLAFDASGTSSEFFIQVSVDDAAWVNAGELLTITDAAKDYSRRVHGSYRYVRLARIGATDLGSLKVTLTGMDVATETGLSDTRCINFEFNVSQTYKIIASDKNLAFYQGTTYLIDIYNPEITNSMLSEIDWESEADTLIIFHRDIQTLKFLRSGANDVWEKGVIEYKSPPTHDFGAVTVSGTMTPSHTSGTGRTITASDNIFTASMVGWTIHFNAGYAKITAYTSATLVTVDIIIDFVDTTAQDDWELREPIWTSSKGYPGHGRFFQGRFWVDGGKSRPSVAYGSIVNDFFNFDFGKALDDEAVGPLSTGFDDIEAIYPGRALMFFSSGGEYVVTQTLGEPITPSNSGITKQSSLGSEQGFRPQEVEGGVLYIQRQGASVQEFIFSDAEQAFANNFVSILSSHLVTGPVDFSLRKATSTEEGAYVLLVRDDGSLTIANILRSQGITSFVRSETTGSFKSCGVDVEDMYFVVERTIDGETVNWLERFNNDHFMDASTRVTTGLPTDTFGGLTHLEGEECRVLADESILGNETPASGSVTIDRDAETSMEIGLNFEVEVIDLPAAASIGSEASLMGRKVNISEISLRLRETSGISINGKLISFRGFGPAGGGSPLDLPPTKFTGVKRTLGWSGWSEDAQVTITQDDPLPMTVLAIKKRLNT